jgi:LysM repeat protein
MKTFIITLVIALFIAGQIITPAAASPSPSAAAASTCGNTYTVQRGDYLSRIAKKCGLTLTQIIAYNPKITNPSRIYPGQVIHLVSGSGIPTTGSTYVVQPGDTLGIIAARFGTTVSMLLALNHNIWNPSLIFVGQVINLPAGTIVPPPPAGPKATLSATSVKAGGTVKITVTGFPASADIDYRIGKQGVAYTTVVDAKTNSAGAHIATLTIPTSAKAGEKWVIVVMTTNLVKGVSVTSPVITIQ